MSLWDHIDAVAAGNPVDRALTESQLNELIDMARLHRPNATDALRAELARRQVAIIVEPVIVEPVIVEPVIVEPVIVEPEPVEPEPWRGGLPKQTGKIAKRVNK